MRSGWRMQDREQAGPASEPCWMVRLLGQSSLPSGHLELGDAMLLPQTSLVPGPSPHPPHGPSARAEAGPRLRMAVASVLWAEAAHGYGLCALQLLLQPPATGSS